MLRGEVHDINATLSLLGTEQDAVMEATRKRVAKIGRIRIMEAHESRYDEKYTRLKSMGGFLMIF